MGYEGVLLIWVDEVAEGDGLSGGTLKLEQVLLSMAEKLERKAEGAAEAVKSALAKVFLFLLFMRYPKFRVRYPKFRIPHP